jgi:hypothetical protein
LQLGTTLADRGFAFLVREDNGHERFEGVELTWSSEEVRVKPTSLVAGDRILILLWIPWEGNPDPGASRTRLAQAKWHYVARK